MIIIKKKFMSKIIEEDQRAASLIPIYSYDKSSDIFLGDDKSLNTAFVCSPLNGFDSQVQKRIDGFLNSEYPKGFVIQFCLYKSPDIARQIDQLLDIRDPYRFELPFYYSVIEERAEFLKHHTDKNIVSDTKRGYYDCGVICDTKLIISFKLPIKNHQPTEDDLIKCKNIQTRFVASLNAIGLCPVRLNQYEYIRLMQTIVNWDEPLWKQKNKSFSFIRPKEHTKFYEEDKPIREQIFDPVSELIVDKKNIQIGETCFIKTLSAKRLPEEIFPGEAISYVGDIMEGSSNSSIQQNYMVCCNLYYPDLERTKSNLEKKRQFAVNQAGGSLVRFIPSLKDKENDFNTLYESYSKGDKPVLLSYTVVTFSRSHEQSDFVAMKLRNLWREKGFELMEDVGIMLPMFVNCLPMCADMEAVTQLRRYKTITTTMATPLIPVMAEWKGTGTFHAALISRTGQLMSLSLHDATTNKNALIAAESGSGKSFLLNELIFSYLSEGTQIWVIDAGKSYQKLNELLDGDFLQFDESTDISLNPFALIGDYTDDEDAVVSLVATMASKDNNLSELQNAALKRIVGEIWNLKQNKMTIDDIAEACLANEDNRVRDIGKQLYAFTSEGSYGKYFNRANTIDFKNKFTVLELDELAGRKHLRQVILLQLIYQIQQAVYLGDRSQKKIVIIDEAWDLLKEGNVATFMEHAYRKFRKYGGAIVIATQSIDDLYTSQTGEAIAKNSASMFLLGQTEESVESVKKTGRLALNDYGYNMLKSVHTIPNVFSEIFLKTKTGIGVGRLIVSDFQKLLYSTAPEDVAAIQIHRDEGLSIIDSIRKVLEERNQQLR
ncbi:type IV secretion system protein TraC [Ruminobacter sp.]|uniref:type IV secretion system protein TraC n=1 Tax=Ruminobacter sp. TaxID=2774296 RepID=UPI003863D3D6